MRIATALAFILVLQIFSLSNVSGEEAEPARRIQSNLIAIPPSSGPIRKQKASPQRVLDLNTVQLVEFEEAAPMPENKPASEAPKTVSTVSIDEFLQGTEVQEPKAFPTDKKFQPNGSVERLEKWQQPVLRVTPNWSPSQKTESASDLEYQAPRQEDVWESADSNSETLEVKSASVTHPQQISAPPPPLENEEHSPDDDYNPMPKPLPMPDAHSNGVWQPIDSMTESSLPYYSDSYYQTSPSGPIECETCWQEGDYWIEEDAFIAQGELTPISNAEFSPVLILGAKGGNDRSLGEVQAMLPLWQSDLDLLFGDIQGRFSDSEESEGHFGLGFRTYLDEEWLLGTYAYYDLRKTYARNRFNQLTVGLELMSAKWDFRLNGYFPNEGYKDSPFETGISNGTIITNNFQERAYRGYNVEVGRRILRWGRFDTSEVRWFVGYYSFDSKASGFRKIDGPRTRVEYRSYDLPFLGPQSRLTAGVEYSNDNLREDQYWGYLRVQIPLSPKVNRSLSIRYADASWTRRLAELTDLQYHETDLFHAIIFLREVS